MNTKPKNKEELRARRRTRVRSRVSGTATRPRLTINRSNRFVSAQLIDDAKGVTIAAAHGRDVKGAQSAQAKAVGEAIAKAAKTKGIKTIIFDRAGYRYTGRVKALADAAREGGLIF